MTRILVDTGPLVAYLNQDDAHHDWAVETLGSLEPPLITCEAVVSESCHLVRDLKSGPATVLALLSREILLPAFSLYDEIGPVHALIEKYGDVPMSLADACLVRMTELDRRSAVLTLDGDFRIYRRNRNEPVPVILPEGR